jgi:hypothetical protein
MLFNSRAALIIRRRVWPAIAPPGLLWADASLRHLRRALPVDGVRAQVDPPARAPSVLTPMVAKWLRWRGATCLERSLIMQRWLLSVGRPHDVLIGVQRPGELIAHAWLDHEDSHGYEVLLRLEPDRYARTHSGVA